ncbi:MAG TPA: phosphoribosylglycinamide formyltransferase [Longimicrobiales bacterium]|nr:phosphoribosylglycinamide formyltransferase [Longimicrobiales bacterium]
MTLRTAVFASGGGSNFQALLDHQSRAGSWEIVLLVTDRSDAGALDRARVEGVATVVVPNAGRETVEAERDLLEVLDEHGIELILLAGYLKLVPRGVVARYGGRMLNIHPALLPKFGGKGMYGMRVHRAVIEAGDAESGATVHFVDEEYDRGAILAQRRVPVLDGDTPEALAARVLAVEHRLYPAAVDHLCEAVAAGTSPEPMLEERAASDASAERPWKAPPPQPRETTEKLQ